MRLDNPTTARAVGWAGPSGLSDLLDDVLGSVTRYVVLGRHEAVASALWAAHTHVFDCFEVTPYLEISSAVPGCAKTLLLEVLEPLVSRPWKTGYTTAAALIRKLHQVKPTLLLDESDAAFGGDKAYAQALRAALNEGFRRRGVHNMCVPAKGGGWEFPDFSVFAPKAIAGLNPLPPTLRSRSIPIRLQMKTAAEAVEDKTEAEIWPALDPVRERLERWAEDASELLRGSRPDVPGELQNRAREAWRPLIAIADLAGGPWPGRARAAAMALSAGRNVVDDTDRVELLADLRRIFVALGNELPTKVIIEELARDESSPWADWWAPGKDGAGGRVAKGVGRKLSSMLKAVDERIKPEQIRIDQRNLRGYKRKRFEDAFARLLASPHSESATSATTRMDTGFEAFPNPLQEEGCSGFENGEKPHEQRDVADVADARGGRGLREVREGRLEVDSTEVDRLDETYSHLFTEDESS